MTDEKPKTRWVTAQDIADVGFGLHLGEPDLDQITPLILRAERLVVSRVPRLEERLNAGTLSKDTVRGVVEGMVLRVIRNPQGVQSDSTAGVSTSFWRSSASGVIELLREDLAQLMPTQRRFGSISVSAPSWRLP